MDVFPARIATPAGVVFEGPVWQIRACNTCGSFAVRAHHAPFLTEMSAGTIEVAAAPDSREAVRGLGRASGILPQHLPYCVRTGGGGEGGLINVRRH